MMRLIRPLALVLTVVLLMGLTACSAKPDAAMELARSAWSQTMGGVVPDSTTAVSHIRFTSVYELADALGIDTARSSFASSGLFAGSGHLFGIVHSGKPRYIVAMDDEGAITWIFKIQSWKTIRGSARVSSLEFTMLATAVSNGIKAVYPQTASVQDNVWRRLTDEQIGKLVE